MTVDQELLKLLDSGGMNFVASRDEEDVFHQKDLVQLFAFGLNVSNDSHRPFLLLKDESQSLTLPVPLNPLEAGMTLTQASQGTLAAPHRFTTLLMESLSIKARQCVFVQIKGAHQFVRIYLQGHPGTNSIKLRADEAMSLCLHANIPLYATKNFIQQSRVMIAELEELGRGTKALPGAKNRTHTYVQ